jgi:hypothetical protein
VIQHPRHDVVDAARRLDKLLTLEIVVVWHVQSVVRNETTNNKRKGAERMTE